MALQDPEFDTFKRAYQSEDFAGALVSLKKLLALYPQSFSLRWHQAKVLEKLERYAEARQVVEKVISARNDFVPALILQVQLDFHQSANEIDDNYDDEAHFTLIEQRLYKILSIDPKSVDALHMLSGLLRGHEGDAHLAKANQLLDRALSLAPERIDLLEDRANSFLASATVQDTDKDDPKNTVTTFSGVRYFRKPLEQALADFQQCYKLSQQHRYGLRAGAILHDLGRFDEALAAYDQVLAVVAEDDPYRPLIIERRARSENNGAGEREHMAQMLEAAIAKGGKDRSLEEDKVAHAIMSAANAVRGGKSVSDALETRISDDPYDNVVTSIAVQILNVANEPHPKLVEADPKNYPNYQQAFIAQCKRDLEPLGLHHVCDAEAEGLKMMLGKSVLLSFFADETGETGVACFCLKPKSISLLSTLFLMLTFKWELLGRQWKTTKMVECVSQYDNGDHLTTQYASLSPFEYEPPIFVKKLPATAPAADLVELHLKRVAEHHQQYPGIKAMRVLDLAGMEERWIKGQAAKRAYRTKIGYITEHELQKLLGNNYVQLGEKVRAKLALLGADII
jgi:tetratricopeptide (TPR) repeat protein